MDKKLFKSKHFLSKILDFVTSWPKKRIFGTNEIGKTGFQVSGIFGEALERLNPKILVVKQVESKVLFSRKVIKNAFSLTNNPSFFSPTWISGYRSLFFSTSQLNISNPAKEILQIGLNTSKKTVLFYSQIGKTVDFHFRRKGVLSADEAIQKKRFLKETCLPAGKAAGYQPAELHFSHLKLTSFAKTTISSVKSYLMRQTKCRENKKKFFTNYKKVFHILIFIKMLFLKTKPYCLEKISYFSLVLSNSFKQLLLERPK